MAFKETAPEWADYRAFRKNLRKSEEYFVCVFDHSNYEVVDRIYFDTEAEARSEAEKLCENDRRHEYSVWDESRRVICCYYNGCEYDSLIEAYANRVTDLD